MTSTITMTSTTSSTYTLPPRSKQGKFGFLRLPLELRLIIYRHLLFQPKVVPVESIPCPLKPSNKRIKSKSSSSNALSILRTNKQISAEALEVLYSSHIFRVQLDCWSGLSEGNLLKNISPSNRSRIRRLAFVILCANDTMPCTGGHFDTSLWSLILARPNLNITIIARHSAPTLDPMGPFEPTEDGESRCAWLEPALREIRQMTPKDARFAVDDDGHEETAEVVHRVLGCSWRRGGTSTGDVVFQREKEDIKGRRWFEDRDECTYESFLADHWY